MFAFGRDVIIEDGGKAVGPVRICLPIVSMLLSMTIQAVASDRVETFVECDQPVIIDGNWLYSENGGHLIVVTDDYLTVDGYEYVHPEDTTLYQYVPPDKEKDFLDWICRTTISGAKEILIEGGSYKEVHNYMEQRFAEYVEDGVFWYEFDEKRGFSLYHKDSRLPLWVSVPTKAILEKRRTYRERVIDSRYRELLYFLEHGYLVMRGTRNASVWKFPPNEATMIRSELKGVSSRAVLTNEGGKSKYQPLLVGGKYKLTPTDVDLLVNPRPLMRRK
jgi:hypothetical protein